MHKNRTYIVVIEPSDVIYEGLHNLLMKNISNCFIDRYSQIDDLETVLLKQEYQIVFLNPRTIENRNKDFNKLKHQYENIKWVGIVYTYIDNETTNKFHYLYKITDDLIQLVSNIIDNSQDILQQGKELSEREIDVLKLLIHGLSNKEIANRLYISTHTVISHRKNIVQKTGIKSLPGLTIYAITKNISQISQEYR